SLKLEPGNAMTRRNLGTALLASGDLDGAAAEFRRAIDREPQNAQSHVGLGSALRNQGRFAGARDVFRRAVVLFASKDPVSGRQAEQQARACEKLARREGHLQALLAGREEPPDSLSRLALAEVCHARGLYARAARLRADALDADPRLSEDFR